MKKITKFRFEIEFEDGNIVTRNFDNFQDAARFIRCYEIQVKNRIYNSYMTVIDNYGAERVTWKSIARTNSNC